MIKVLMRQCCFFKQKTAYEMRISDWSSDVCSSDLLQVLAFYDKWLRDSRNWAGQKMAAGSWHFARWIDLDNPESPADDLRARGAKKGAAVFARGEGIHWGRDELYFTCTSGGRAQQGQIMRYRPSRHEGKDREQRDRKSTRLNSS